jgi:hypothetical protein
LRLAETKITDAGARLLLDWPGLERLVELDVNRTAVSNRVRQELAERIDHFVGRGSP